MRKFLFIIALISVLGVVTYIQYDKNVTEAKHECYKIVVDKSVNEIKELCGE